MINVLSNILYVSNIKMPKLVNFIFIINSEDLNLNNFNILDRLDSLILHFALIDNI